jgi:hypothetical protein
LTAIKARPGAAGQAFAMNEKPMIEAGSCRVLNLALETQFAPNGIVSRAWRASTDAPFCSV